MSEPLLRAEGLVKSFGGVAAVDGVTLSVEKGELRCLLGPNGAGKSTLFNMLCGFYLADSGTIWYAGRDITRLPTFQRVQYGLGLKFQTARVYYNLTVGHNLDVALEGHTRHRAEHNVERYLHALDKFGLVGQLERFTRDLPHAELQWLEICMALATGPDLLMLDEPTTGMTPAETLFTAEVTRSLNATGLTIIVVEHDMAFVREVAQTITVLHQGRIFAEGNLEEISANEEVRRIYLGDAVIGG